MKLSQTVYALIILLLAAFSVACNDKTEINTTDPSADPQIYIFSLSATPTTGIDSVNYPFLSTTKFAIDQFRDLIYNPDSLPFRTRMAKFKVTLTYASSGAPSKVELVYPKDSVVTWNGSDSVDFAVAPLYPKFRVTPANGKGSKEYTIKVLVHQIDTDTIVWKQMSSQPATVGKQKTILVGETFYTFSLGSDNKLYLNKADRNTLTWGARANVNGFATPSSVLLQNITYFNKTFFAADGSQRGYTSTDGLNWTQRNTNVANIVGVLPGKTVVQDSLLVVVQNAGSYYFAKTLNLQSPLRVVDQITGYPQPAILPSGFPITSFTSVTNYDRVNANNNLLAVTGFDADKKYRTWSIRTDEQLLELMSSQPSYILPNLVGMTTFLYNGSMYGLTGNEFYTTSSWGYKWSITPTKQKLDAKIPLASGQSVIVDNGNYIWLFGGIDKNGVPVQQVWRGRLNKLNPRL